MTVRLETIDAAGRPVTSSDYGSVYRGVAFEGADAGHAPPPREAAMASGGEVLRVDIPAGLAHIYSECARIWNPIHTDIAIARAAGLPGIILHGTATLALAVSCVLRHAGVDPRMVRRIGGRFTDMVPLPSSLAVHLASPSGDGTFRFDVTRDDEVVMRGGALHLA